MDIRFRKANKNDKDFIINGNNEINAVSGLHDSFLEENIDKDLFEKKVCKAILVEVDNQPAGFLLYSYIYWANRGKGIYLSQAYVMEQYRQQGLLKKLLEELVNQEKDIKFITDYVGQENETMIKAMGKLCFKTSDLMVYYKLN